MINIVKRLEALTVARSANLYCRAVKAGVIKRVHRLTVLKHYVVGYINDIVDRTNAACAKAHTEPERRRSDLNVLYNSCNVSRAEIGSGYRNREIIAYLVSVVSALYYGSLNREGLVKGDSTLASKTDNRKTVGTVGGYLKLNDGVVKHKSFLDVHTELVAKALVKNKNTVRLLAGHIVLGKSKLTHRAEHTVGLNAAKLTGLDNYISGELCHGNSRRNDSALKNVLCAGNYLLYLRADINLTDLKVIAVLVRSNRENTRNNNVFYILAENLIALNLRAGVGHSITIILNVNVRNVNEISKPIFR